MKKLLERWLVTLFLSLMIVLSFNSPVFAINQTLVPCQESQAFQDLQKRVPNTYYFDKPMQAYSSNLLCGADDGLPHLTLDRLSNVIDAIIPFSIFFYVAGLIGWSGRAYLQKSNKASNPEEQEIFINLPTAIAAIFQGLLWPLLFLKELASGELTAKENEISVSPR